jgi:hypothetical protein
MTSPTDKVNADGAPMSQRMFAAWSVARDEFEKQFPHAHLSITKGAFSPAPPGETDSSAGYHDLSGPLDVVTNNMFTAEGKPTAESEGLVRIARSIGWAAWLRGPTLPGEFPEHVHMALLGEPETVNGKPFVDDGLINQMKAYKTEGGGGCCGHGGNGLTGDSARDDPHPRPDPIPEFDYDEWENDMKLTDPIKLTGGTAEALGDGLKEGDEITVGGLLQKIARHAALAVKLDDPVKLTEATADALGRGLQEGDTITVGGLLQKMARHAALADQADTAGSGGTPG